MEASVLVLGSLLALVPVGPAVHRCLYMWPVAGVCSLFQGDHLAASAGCPVPNGPSVLTLSQASSALLTAPCPSHDSGPAS